MAHRFSGFSKVLEHRAALIATIVGSGLLLICAALYWLDSTRYELPIVEGRLYPANEPMPSNPCRDSVLESDLVVLLGVNAVRVDTFPLSLVNVEGQDRLVLDRGDNGSIVVSLDILKDDGGIDIRFTKGDLAVSNNHVPKRRKDRNSLEITDSSGTQILKMRYANKHTLWIDAVLRYQGLDNMPVIFSGSTSAPTDIGATDTEIRHHCYYNRGIALLYGE